MEYIKMYLGTSADHGSFYSSTVRKPVSFGGLGEVTMTIQTKGKVDDVKTVWMNDLDCSEQFETLPRVVWYIEKLEYIAFTEDDAKQVIEESM